MSSKKIHIGTSGWNYKHWKEVFYPEDIKKKDWFDYYAEQFDTVEINNTFYNLPEEKTIKEWKENSPADFLYVLKASRYMTHMKKLKDPEEPIDNFFSVIKHLKAKLGVVLFQLPPGWKFNKERLENFLNKLPEDYNYVFEFREKSWWNDDTYELLKKHNAAFCIYHMVDEETPREITSNTIYIRLHGTDDKYKGSYSPQQLSGWKRWIDNRKNKAKDIYIFFNNDDKGYAAQNALKLKRLF